MDSVSGSVRDVCMYDLLLNTNQISCCKGIPFFRSATGQRSFSYRAVQLWNDLPESLTYMESFNVFKNANKGRALDKFLSH